MILSHLVGGLLQNSFVNVRVEGVAYFTETLHTLLAEQLFELGSDGGEGAFLQVAVLACGVDIIEHRQQRGHQFTGYEASQLLLFAGGAVLEVSELGLQAKQGVQALCGKCRIRRFCFYGVLELSLDGFRSFLGAFDRFSFGVAFRCGGVECLLQRVGGGVFLLSHDYFFSSSSITSASTTSSSAAGLDSDASACAAA